MVSPAAEAIKFALAQQLIIFLLAGSILDGGAIAQICFYGFAAFWAATFLLLRRGKGTITKLDLAFIQGGSLLLCLLSYFLTTFIWKVRGVW